jgi:hypothetical protein
MGTLHDTAEAVKTLIAAGSFSKTVDPVLAYSTDLELEDAGTLHVDVVAAGLSQAPDSRSSLEYNALIDVAVRYRFGASERQSATQQVTLANIEGYVDLLEEIAEHLATPANRALSTKTDATWIRNEIRVPWLPQHLRENGQYTGIFRATYYVAKDL